MIRFFEERFLLSNILEVGEILLMGAGYYENYYIASKGFRTVSVNVLKAVNPFIVAKMLRNPVNIDLFSIDLGGFNFPYEFFDYAAFVNNSLELIPYRSNRVDMLKFVNRFLKNEGFLSISLYNINSPINIEKFKKGEFITKAVDSVDSKSYYSQPVLDKGDYFYYIDNPLKEERFRHIYDENELREDLEASGFELVEFTDNEKLSEKLTREMYKTSEKLKARFLIVSAKKVRSVKITKTVNG